MADYDGILGPRTKAAWRSMMRGIKPSEIKVGDWVKVRVPADGERPTFTVAGPTWMHADTDRMWLGLAVGTVDIFSFRPGYQEPNVEFLEHRPFSRPVGWYQITYEDDQEGILYWDGGNWRPGPHASERIAVVPTVKVYPVDVVRKDQP